MSPPNDDVVPKIGGKAGLKPPRTGNYNDIRQHTPKHTVPGAFEEHGGNLSLGLEGKETGLRSPEGLGLHLRSAFTSSEKFDLKLRQVECYRRRHEQIFALKMGARLSVRRKKSRVAQQVPERRRRISSQSRPRFRSPQRESHPYDDVYSVAARESGPYDEVLHSADVYHNPRAESQQYDDVFLGSVSYRPRRELQPYHDVFSSPPQRAVLSPPRITRGAYGVRSGGERQNREGTLRYRDYYNLDLVTEPTGSSRTSQGHGRASRSQVRESAGYVTPNAVAQWQVAVFREELARERSESVRETGMQRPVRKYTFQSRFEKT